MSKSNSTMGWVLGFGALAVAGIAYFKNKGGTQETDSKPYSESDLIIGIEDLTGPEFSWERFVGAMKYVLTVSLTNKSKEGVGIKYFEIELFDDTKQITTMPVYGTNENGEIDKTKEAAFFVPKETVRSPIDITSNTGRTLQLLGIGYPQIVWYGTVGKLTNWAVILNRYIQVVSLPFTGTKKQVLSPNYDAALKLCLDPYANTGVNPATITPDQITPAYEMFPTGFKYGKEITVKVSAILNTSGFVKISSSKKFII